MKVIIEKLKNWWIICRKIYKRQKAGCGAYIKKNKKMFNFKSVTIKLFFLFLLVGLIPLVLVSYLSIRSSEQGIKKEILQGLKRYTEAKESQIIDYFYFIESNGRYLSDEKFLIDGIKKRNNGLYADGAEINNFLKSKKKSDESLAGISILDLKGEIIFSSDESETGKDESSHDHFKEIIKNSGNASAGPKLISHEHFGLANSFIVSYQIKNEKGDPLAILEAVFNLDRMAKILNGDFQAKKEAPGGIFGAEGLGNYIINKEKMMFIYPAKNVYGRDNLGGLTVDSLPVRECFKNGKEVAASYKTYTGKEVLGASKCVEDMEWVVISEIEADKAFLAVKEIYYQLVLMIIVSFLLVVGISLILAGKISEYLNKFVLVAQKVSRGDLNVQIEINAEDEIGFVAKNFNKMIISLKKSRDNIEKKVSERTKDLENINKYMVGREIRMIELKKKIDDLEKNDKKNQG